ncbi:MAG: hypothetical protein ACQEQP_08390 [Bacillota bacterium]
MIAGNFSLNLKSDWMRNETGPGIINIKSDFIGSYQRQVLIEFKISKGYSGICIVTVITLPCLYSWIKL